MNKFNSILLVDDDKASNFLNELLIKKLSITDHLFISRNGKEAIDLLKGKCVSGKIKAKDMPQLILLDINMPVMDGFGFLKAFAELKCIGKENAMIAVLTTSLNPRDEEQVRAAGIRHFLNKPLTSEVLQNLKLERLGEV